jgi:hypothetical protein
VKMRTQLVMHVITNWTVSLVKPVDKIGPMVSGSS